MDAVYFALVCLAIVYVIFWCVRSEQFPPDEIGGPFAMRADGERTGSRKRVKRIR